MISIFLITKNLLIIDWKKIFTYKKSFIKEEERSDSRKSSSGSLGTSRIPSANNTTSNQSNTGRELVYKFSLMPFINMQALWYINYL